MDAIEHFINGLNLSIEAASKNKLPLSNIITVLEDCTFALRLNLHQQRVQAVQEEKAKQIVPFASIPRS